MRTPSVFITMPCIVFIFLCSCSKKGTSTPPPNANFTYSGAGLAPALVNFTNVSSNAITYLWDFGDNGTSVLANPTHTYTQGGNYTVRLTATGPGGTNYTTKNVNVQTPTSVKILSIKLMGIAFTDGAGAGWDNNTGPDVFMTLDDANDVNLATSGTFANVTAFPPNLIWNLTTAYQVTNFASTYKIRVYDEDLNDIPPNPNDFISGYSFNFTQFANSGYPTTVTLQLTGNPLKVELGLVWQ
jgi:hypothetical protein